MGLYAPVYLPNVPVVSFVQGPAGAEWQLIHELRKIIIKNCGLKLYLKLKLYYLIKDQQVFSSIRNSDFLICGSEWSKSKVVESGFESHKVYILPYPISIDQFSNENSHRTQRVSKEKVLLHLGRLDPRKRLDLLLDAFALVLQKRSDVRLKIVGSFNYVPTYYRLIQAFPFPDKLDYQASVPPDEVPKLMKNSDLLIQSSEGENFGSSVAEALCCGLPVVLGSTNGTKDYLGDSSFVFDDYTPESLSNSIITALDAIEKDPLSFSIAARRAAEENFNVTDITDQILEIFNTTFTQIKKGTEVNSKPEESATMMDIK